MNSIPGSATHRPSRRRTALIIAAAGLVAALGILLVMRDAHLSGTFRDPDGNGRLEFRGARVYVTTALGTTFVSAYEVDGDRIIIKGAGGAQVYTRKGEMLDGGLGIRFVRQTE